MESVTAAVKPARRVTVAVRVGVLAAVAFALMYLEFHIPGFPTFLQYDAGDLPALVGGFAMGPLAGVSVVFIRSALFLLSGKDEAGWLGTMASLFSSVFFVGVATLIYRWRRSLVGALLGLAGGIAACVAGMALANYFFFIPAYLGRLEPAVLLGLVRMTGLFNLVKGSITSVLTFLIYKRVSYFLR